MNRCTGAQVKSLVRALCIAALTALVGPFAQAEENTRDFYIDGDLGPAVFGILPDTITFATITSIAGGIGGDGRIAVCTNGLDNVNWLDLCGGVTGFLGNFGLAIPGLGATIASNIQSVGAYAQAKATFDWFMIAPYIGGRQIWSETSASVFIFKLRGTTGSFAVFGGTELGISLADNRIELGLRAEAGRSITGPGYTYVSGSAFIGGNF
jgi:hypothetical protein